MLRGCPRPETAIKDLRANISSTSEPKPAVAATIELVARVEMRYIELVAAQQEAELGIIACITCVDVDSDCDPRWVPLPFILHS